MSAVVQMQYIVLGKTRDEAMSKLDSIGIDLLDLVGGAPWLAVDDDVVKEQTGSTALADDQGYTYRGKRTYVFQGPVVRAIDVRQHEGFSAQKGVEE